jgi:Tfp pilus assembly protein PilO
MSVSSSRMSHRKQQMWVYIITGLFVCDFVLCGYIPSQQRLRTLRQAQAEQRKVIAMAAAQSVALSGLEQRLRDMERRIEGFDHRVPVDRTLGTFLQQIAGIMKDCHLVDQVVLPGTEVKTEALNCIPIHVACHGTLASTFRFFTKLQSLDRLVRIENVRLENDPDLTGQLGAQIEAVIFEQAARPRTNEGRAEAKSAGGVSHGA